MALLPWHTERWQQLVQADNEQRLPHAVLFSGMADIGKGQFASQFAAYLLCDSPQQQMPCGQCHSCRLLEAGNHPDLVRLQPQENSKAIRVDEVRTFVADAALTPQIARRRATIINPAEAMNQAAANSLLKTLEEPNAENHILLVSHAPWELAATIRSRCQQIAFPKPERQVVLDWLMQQKRIDEWPEVLDCVRDAPLRAIEFYQQQGLDRYRAEKRRFAALIAGKVSLVDVGAAWNADETGLIAEWIYQWMLDLLRARHADTSMMRDSELALWLKDLIPRLDSARLLQSLDDFSASQRGIRTRNLNAQMQYEAVASALSEVVH